VCFSVLASRSCYVLTFCPLFSSSTHLPILYVFSSLFFLVVFFFCFFVSSCPRSPLRCVSRGSRPLTVGPAYTLQSIAKQSGGTHGEGSSEGGEGDGGKRIGRDATRGRGAWICEHCGGRLSLKDMSPSYFLLLLHLRSPDGDEAHEVRHP